MDPFILVLVVMLGFVVLMIADSRRRKDESDRAPRLPRLVAWGSTIGAGVSALVGVVTVVLAVEGDRVTLAVPVIVRIEAVPDDLRAMTDANVTSGLAQQTPIALTVAGLDMTTRVLVALHLAALAAIAITVLLVIARAARQSTAELPFSGALSRLLVISGATLAIGGVVTQVFSNAAGMRVHAQLFELSPAAAAGSTYVSPTWSFELWPLGVGLVVIVVARLVSSGERLQRDTEGLV
ncbi:hypothetical protein EV141_2190 [Microcella putealis]|uniref:DUF2975 family protein n=1 Tax=Microcella putealis TaxID=337005 RepID=A0A4V2EW94_9MICO|nr:hypothetical protein [Microcella putealis]RZS55200.1 hypothetical protein EV141_2190 [Microcella putealis]TQM23538.1 hypothetical protein BJ957_1907 [Microcella putealis]